MDSTASLKNLNQDVKAQICNQLNKYRVVKNIKNIPRDWRGLAIKLNIPDEAINEFRSRENHTEMILLWWNLNSSETYTINNLRQYLEELDRYDILDDNNLEDTLRNSSDIDERHSNYSDDLPNAGYEYDAFVLYSSQDEPAAVHIIRSLEDRFNFKICHADESVAYKDQTVLEKMHRKCKKVIVLLTNAFIQDQLLQIYVNSVRSDAIRKKISNRVIPIQLYENFEKPDMYQNFACLKYFKQTQLTKFWETLAKNVQGELIYSGETALSNDFNYSFNSNFHQMSTAIIQSTSSLNSQINGNDTGSDTQSTSSPKPSKKNVFKKIFKMKKK